MQQKNGLFKTVLLTGLLAGSLDISFAYINVTVTSGKCDGRPNSLPKRIRYLPKPWRTPSALMPSPKGRHLR